MEAEEPVCTLDGKIEGFLKQQQTDPLEWLYLCVNMSNKHSTLYGSDIGKSYVERHKNIMESFQSYCEEIYNKKNKMEINNKEHFETAEILENEQDPKVNIIADHQYFKNFKHRIENEIDQETENDNETDTGVNSNKQKVKYLEDQDCVPNFGCISVPANIKDYPGKTENTINLIEVDNDQNHYNHKKSENINNDIKKDDAENHNKVASLQNVLTDVDVSDDSGENYKEILNHQNVLTNDDESHDDKVNHREIPNVQNVLANEDHSSEHDNNGIHILPDGSAWKQVYFICQIKQEVVDEGDESSLPVKSSRQEVEITHILDRDQFFKTITKSGLNFQKNENFAKQFEFSKKVVGQEKTESDIFPKSECQDELDAVSDDSTIIEDYVDSDQPVQSDDNFEKMLQEVNKQDTHTVVENFVTSLDQFEPDYQMVKNQTMINTVRESETVSSENKILDQHKKSSKKSNIFVKENRVSHITDSGKGVPNMNTQLNGDPKISRDFRNVSDNECKISATKSCFVLLEDFEKTENCSKETCYLKGALCNRKYLKNGSENSSVDESINRMKLRSKARERKEELLRCMFCQKQFMSKKGLKQHGLHHIRELNDDTLYHCLICNREFRTKRGIVYHMKFVECYKEKDSVSMAIYDNNELKCRICSRVYSRKEHLRRHQRTIHKLNNTVKSKLSNTTRTNLLKTVVKNLKTKSRNVAIATKSTKMTGEYTIKGTVVENPILVLGFRNYKCQVCNKPYHNFGLLKIHLKRIHSKFLSQKWLTYLDSGPQIARIRKKNSATTLSDKQKTPARVTTSLKSSTLLSDVQNVSVRKGIDSTLSDKKIFQRKLLPNNIESLQYKCQFCSKKFDRVIQLNFHIKQRHSDSKTMATNSDESGTETCKFRCSMCGKRYQTYSGLFKHKKGHHGNNPKCPDCGKIFPSELHLKYHSSIHKKGNVSSNKKKINVKLSKGSNVSHVGTDKKPTNQCTICQKKFLETYQLQHHMVITHTHLPKKICKICKKQFKNKTTLMNHVFVHMEKRLACQVCERKYSHINRLRSHVKDCHPGIHYQCKKCGELFYVPADYEKHKQIHHT